jgi:hypothetical protein
VGNVEASAEGVKREGDVRLAGEGERNANIEDPGEGHDYDDDDCPPSKT